MYSYRICGLTFFRTGVPGAILAAARSAEGPDISIRRAQCPPLWRV